MHATQSAGHGIAPYLRNLDTFRDHNLRRIAMLRNSLSDSKRVVFDLLPVLLHEHGPGLPGFLHDGVPAGISSFALTPGLKELIRTRFPNAAVSQQVKPRLPIRFLAVMGSAGSIGFTHRSDLDFWIGIDLSDRTPAASQGLRQKLETLETWAADAGGLEAHFFLVDLGAVRKEVYGEVGGESCGSSLGKLLKEEFYRTALFLHGSVPYYWLTPCGLSDMEYGKTVRRLECEAAFPRQDMIDMGNASSVDPAEFSGAALWHIVKAIRSPFKSVLKTALLDRYSVSRDRPVPVCESYKQLVLSRPGEVPDPFLHVIETVRSFYIARGLGSLRQLIEECVLIRGFTHDTFSPPAGPVRRARLCELGRSWGWSEGALEELARFRQWDFFRQENLRKRITGYLVDTYSRIRARTGSVAAAITSRDLTVLGRTVASLLEQKQGKIPWEFSFIEAGEIAAIDLVEQHERDRSAGWCVRLRIASQGEKQFQVSRMLSHFVAACAWVALNRFLDEKTALHTKGKSVISQREIVKLIRCFTGFFPRRDKAEIEAADLLRESAVTHAYFVPNWDCPDEDGSIASLVIVFRTTAGELFFKEYRGREWSAWVRDWVLTHFEKRPGSGPTCAVHLLKGNVTSTRRISGLLSRFIQDLLAQISLRPDVSGG